MMWMAWKLNRDDEYKYPIIYRVIKKIRRYWEYIFFTQDLYYVKSGWSA